MRGKKIDTQFLTDFIGQCVTNELITPEEMIFAAQTEINIIDEQIKETEKLKVRRSKLLDVITTFQKPVKTNKHEARILSFFQIQNPQICKTICDQIKNQPQKRDGLNHPQYTFLDINFCIKQLLEHRVIAKIGDSFLRGDMFDEYSKFVLQED